MQLVYIKKKLKNDITFIYGMIATKIDRIQMLTNLTKLNIFIFFKVDCS